MTLTDVLTSKHENVTTTESNGTIGATITLDAEKSRDLIFRAMRNGKTLEEFIYESIFTERKRKNGKTATNSDTEAK